MHMMYLNQAGSHSFFFVFSGYLVLKLFLVGATVLINRLHDFILIHI